MPLRPCLDCGRLSAGPRCPEHQRARDRVTTRLKRQRRPYTPAEQRRRAAVVGAWRRLYGDWCPGWQREAHAASDLTADHFEAVANGGEEGGPLGVLCRSCNGRKSRSLG